MTHSPPTAEPEIPAELSLPSALALEVPDLCAAAPGQLIELHDGQQVLMLLTSKTDTGITATVLRVSWPREGVLPLGETLIIHSTDALAQGPLRVLGAWYAATEVPKTERVVLEAIRRGFITRRTCGVEWPLAPRWQLSEQAAREIEKYLFAVARSTGVAFPFHDITAAMRKMHLQVSLDNPGLCDIAPGDNPGHQPRTDEEMLSVWARELQRKVHASEVAFGAQTPTDVAS